MRAASKPLFVERGPRAPYRDPRAPRRAAADARSRDGARSRPVFRHRRDRPQNTVHVHRARRVGSTASRAIMDCLGSRLTKYAEGLPGNVIMEATRSSTRSRTSARAARSGVPIVPDEGASTCSPTPARRRTLRCMSALSPHARTAGLTRRAGSFDRRFHADKKTMSRKPVSATSVYFDAPVPRAPETGLIDFDELAKTAGVFKPALIVCGGSAYPRIGTTPSSGNRRRQWLIINDGHGPHQWIGRGPGGADSFKYCDIVTTTISR